MKIKVYLPDMSFLTEDVYLEGSFKIVVNKEGQPITVYTRENQPLTIGEDCSLVVEDTEDAIF